MSVAYSNHGTAAASMTNSVPDARFFDRNAQTGSGRAVTAPIDLAPGEVQVLVPA